MKRTISLLVLAAMSTSALADQPVTTAPAYGAKPQNPVALVSLATGVNLSPAKESISGGEINWTRGVVYALGSASARPDAAKPRAMAQRGAYLVAARNAALVLAGIPVGPGGRFKNIRNGRIHTDVKLKKFRELPGSYNPATRTAKARLEIPIYGISGVVEKLSLVTRPVASRWAWPRDMDVDELHQSDVIVIDARGLGFSPCLLPSLVTPDGKSVFEAGDISVADLLDRPIVRYAVLSRRVVIPAESSRKYRKKIYRSFTLRPIKIFPRRPGTIVLSRRDLVMLEKHADSQNLLKSGKVLIVLDKE